MQFTKLFSSILDSTIWQEPPATKLVWITMLAMVDRNGEVHTSIPGLAKRAGVTNQECETALACFQSPDPYSRTKDHEGRRIRVIDGGFELLNHGKYRALLSAEERREYNRKKQQEYREIKRLNGCLNVNDVSMTVIDNVSNAHITDTNTDTDTDELIRANPKRFASFEDVTKWAESQPMGIPKECTEAFFDKMEEIGWVAENGLPLACWKARFRRYATNWINNLNAPNKYNK